MKQNIWYCNIKQVKMKGGLQIFGYLKGLNTTTTKQIATVLVNIWKNIIMNQNIIYDLITL